MGGMATPGNAEDRPTEYQQILNRLMTASDERERDQAGAEALLVGGLRALPDLQRWRVNPVDVLHSVLEGGLRTGRADHSFRQGALCRLVLALEGTVEETLTLRLAAGSGLLDLSVGALINHPTAGQDRSMATQALRDVAQQAAEYGHEGVERAALSALRVYGQLDGADADQAVARIGDTGPALPGGENPQAARLFARMIHLLGHGSGPDEFIRLAKEAVPLLGETPTATILLVTAASKCYEAGRRDNAHRLLTDALQHLDGALARAESDQPPRVAGDSTQRDGVKAVRAEAASLLAKYMLLDSPGSDSVATAVGELLRPSLEHLRSVYQEVVVPQDIESARRQLSAAVDMSLEAAARRGDWSAVFHEVDGAKGLRSRERRLLRRSEVGRRVLQLERALFVADRGVTATVGDERADAFASEVPAAATLREQLRQARAEVGLAALHTPTLEELGAALAPGEAAVLLAERQEGTTVFVCGRTTEGSVRHESLDLPGWGEQQWFDRLEPWIVALLAELPDAGSVEDVLAGVDDLWGRWTAALLGEWGTTRLYVIPHRTLALLPLWALPTLRHLDTVVEVSAADLYERLHSPRPALEPAALLVKNPTGDLAVAAAGSNRIGKRLRDEGFSVDHLSRQEADRAHVAPALKHASLLHFIGHGWRDALRSETSSLCLAARENAMWYSTGPLLDILDFSSEPEQADRARSRVVEGVGRITEWREDGVVRRMVETAYETFLGRWVAEDLRFAAELLTAEDLATTGGLDQCSLAVLMACDTGPLDPRPSAVREPSGLPQALRLAGAHAVVATAWAIHEVVSVIFSELLYNELLNKRQQMTGSTGSLDVAGAVAAAVTRLRTLDHSEAAGLLQTCADAARGADAFRLRECARRLAAGPERPFDAVATWGAFYLTGVPVLQRTWGEDQSPVKTVSLRSENLG